MMRFLQTLTIIKCAVKMINIKYGTDKQNLMLTYNQQLLFAKET